MRNFLSSYRILFQSSSLKSLNDGRLIGFLNFLKEAINTKLPNTSNKYAMTRN